MLAQFVDGSQQNTAANSANWALQMTAAEKAKGLNIPIASLGYPPGWVERYMTADQLTDALGANTADKTSAIATAASLGQIFFSTVWPSTSSIAGFHAAYKYGPGGVLRNGNTFLVQLPYTGTNNLYASGTGLAANDGLSATEPMSGQASMDALQYYIPIYGNWIVNLANGTFTDGIQPPTGIWSPIPVIITGPSGALPFDQQCIFDGTAATKNFAINLNGENNIHVKHVKIQNFSGNPLGSYGIVGQLFSQLHITHVHTENCDNSIKLQQGRLYIHEGCIIGNGTAGITGISNETHSIGNGCNSTGTQDLATTAASGTGSIATISFPVQATAPQVGGYCVVRGVTPTGYNTPLAIVTASTTSSVSYLSTATGPQTVAGTVDYDYGCSGVGPYIYSCSQTGLFIDENATGHADWTTCDSNAIAFDIVASSRVHAISSKLKNNTTGVRARGSSHWLNDGTSLFGNNNNNDEVLESFSMELLRSGGFFSQLRQPLDNAFVSWTGFITPGIQKTYAAAIRADTFTYSGKSWRVIIIGEYFGAGATLAGSANVTLKITDNTATAQSVWGFTIPAGTTNGSYRMEGTFYAQNVSVQSYNATNIMGTSTTVGATMVTSGQRTINMGGTADKIATIVSQLGNAADTITFRIVEQWETG